MKKVFLLVVAFICLSTVLSAADYIGEVYPVSNKVKVLFNDVDDTFVLYVSNEENKEMILFNDKKVESIKSINDFIFQMSYRQTYFFRY